MLLGTMLTFNACFFGQVVLLISVSSWVKTCTKRRSEDPRPQMANEVTRFLRENQKTTSSLGLVAWRSRKQKCRIVTPKRNTKENKVGHDTTMGWEGGNWRGSEEGEEPEVVLKKRLQVKGLLKVSSHTCQYTKYHLADIAKTLKPTPRGTVGSGSEIGIAGAGGTNRREWCKERGQVHGFMGEEVDSTSLILLTFPQQRPR